MTEQDQKDCILNSDKTFIKLKHSILVYKMARFPTDFGGYISGGRKVIVTLVIPKGATVFTGIKQKNNWNQTLKQYVPGPNPLRKMRATSARVLMVEELKGGLLDSYAVSNHSNKFKYEAGKKVRPTRFAHRADECAGGIHFFLTRKEAESYSG